MKNTFKFLLAALAVLVLSAGVALAGEAVAVKAFKVKDAKGAEFTNKNIEGKTAVFVVVQTACSQCRGELLALSAKYDELKAKADIYTVLVDVNSERALSVYAADKHKMPALLDPGFTIPDMAGLGVTPSTIVVKGGKITYTKTGYRGEPDLKKLIEAL